MICNQCGCQNADVLERVGFCQRCGASLSKLEGTCSPTSLPRTAPPLPYLWGNIQGWIQIIWGIATGLLAWVAVSRGLSSFKLRSILIVSAVLYLFTGIGILRKRTYVLVLVCVSMILTVVMYFQVLFVLPSRSDLLPVARTLYWILSFFYYLRRRRDLKPGW
jgi:hypothetical protein